MTKLGIFGGTFDPIHNGHLRIADTILDLGEVDRIIFIPSDIPPHKPHQHILPFEYRWNMVNLAIAGHSGLAASDMEHQLGGISYTVRTLEALQKNYPDAHLFLIIGSDSLLGLPKWKDPEKLIAMSQLIVFPRSNAGVSGAEKRFLEHSRLLDVPLVSVSSSDIRSRVAQKLSIKNMVPEKVESYISEHNLYQIR